MNSRFLASRFGSGFRVQEFGVLDLRLHELFDCAILDCILFVRLSLLCFEMVV